MTPAGAVSTFFSNALGGSDGLAFDAADNLYVANRQEISEVTPGGAVSTFVSGLGGADGLAFDAAGNLYVSIYGNNTVSKVTSAGVVSTFVSSGLDEPEGLAFDAAGNLYVANYGNNTISKVTPAGAVSTFVSSGIDSPFGLAFDGAGNLYVANWVNDTISKVTPAGVISTFVSSGLNFPRDLAFDAAGNLYVANFYGDTISRVTPAGAVSTFVSSGLDAPAGLALDGAGNLYVANFYCGAISKVTFATLTATDATTGENEQTTSGLVVTPNANDAAVVTTFQIANITGGSLFLNDGVTPVSDGQFITVAQGAAGLRFTPTPGSLANGSFTVEESTTGDASGLIAASTVTATITVLAPTPTVTIVATVENAQTTSGLVITPGPVDTSLVANYLITGITGGSLFLNDGVTAITNGEFITVAQGAAGLRFTPTTGSLANGSFTVQDSTTADASGLLGVTTTAAIAVLPFGTWSGDGDGTTWSDRANWVGGVVPTAADNVVINVAGNPTIIYDASAGSTTIQDLPWAPATRCRLPAAR